MPTFLWFYVAGLTASLVVGFIFYYALGSSCVAFFQKVFGERAGELWGRTFRLMLVTTALIGGLTTQWYGLDCHGNIDYKAVASDPRLMFQKTTEQVGGATDYPRILLLVVANVGVITYAVLWRKK